MIVTCPACTTRYLVDPRALGDAGRVVRCANCSKTWHQTPPEDLPLTLIAMATKSSNALGCAIRLQPHENLEHADPI